MNDPPPTARGAPAHHAGAYDSRIGERAQLGITVSVEHGHGRVTLSVPDDVAVESLLPPLLDACGADTTATWTLAPRGGAPIAARRTLREAGVPPGAVLALRMT
ncbi:MAG TPA: EsaB/YukD family protein, partial [Candidatus Dormibacteraeota bacterium]|nr:EsaB/YukD family protein [Candidatus Dormibacteraeota bacterium]